MNQMRGEHGHLVDLYGRLNEMVMSVNVDTDSWAGQSLGWNIFRSIYNLCHGSLTSYIYIVSTYVDV